MFHMIDATGVGQAVFPSDSYGQERGCVANEMWVAMLRVTACAMRMYVRVRTECVARYSVANCARRFYLQDLFLTAPPILI